MDKYKRIRVLGKGASGQVFLVEDTETGELCAVKQIHTDLASSDDAARQNESALKEAALLRALDHPHIVRYHEVFITRSGSMCLIMDYADGGDLHVRLRKQRDTGLPLPVACVIRWLWQLCDALKYLHG